MTRKPLLAVGLAKLELIERGPEGPGRIQADNREGAHCRPKLGGVGDVHDSLKPADGGFHRLKLEAT